MKKILLSIFAAALFLLPSGVLADTENYIVSIKDGENISTAFENKYHLTQLTTKDHGLYVTDEKSAEKLENNPKVEDVAEINYLYLSATANDPEYVSGHQWSIDAINAAYGWSLPKGKTSTVVVIDTGFDFKHEDKGNIFPGKDLIANKETDHDYFTHGTGCAGVIGAATNNGIGIAGLTDQCNVIVFSVFKADSKGEPAAEDAKVIAAIYSAVDDYHADVISMSLGGKNVNKNMEDAVRYAYEHNTILVAATGNSGTGGSPLEFPAAYDEVIGIGNMNASYQIDSKSTKNESVYVSAPGTGILTLSNKNYNGNAYMYATGTSLATPHVAALAALAKAQDPSITPEEFKYYLRTTSTDLETDGYDIASGYGLINYEMLLKSMAEDNNSALAGLGTVQSPYIINNESDLRRFCIRVAAGETNAAARLNADIAVSDKFSGISIEYNGVFDGNGHRISGIKESLFDTIGAKGIIQNLTLYAEINNDIYGGILATENHGIILNCHTEGKIESETTGGICGINTGTIRDCSNQAAVYGINTAGIAAISNGGTIAQCYNHGEIRSGNSLAGGVCCFLQNGASLSRCYNTGSVAETNGTGGIVHSVFNATVFNCYYVENTVKNGTSTVNVCAKSADYMKTKGFVCMLNHGSAVFTTDADHRNNGYPIPGASDLTTYFTDVKVSLWYADPIYTLTADKILQGRGNHLFCPDSTVTRAEFVTILANTAGTDLSAQKIMLPFSDVPQNSWYAAAISWAYEQNLAYGKSTSQFCPDDPVTREEISSFLMRYIHRYSQKDLPPAKEMTFSDTNQISDWAKEDTAQLTTMGIINGFPDGTFRPQSLATRGQAAQLTQMMRLQL